MHKLSAILFILISTLTSQSQNYKETQKLVASDRAINDQFSAVSFSGNYAIVGAAREDEDVFGSNTLIDAGSAYVFERDTSGNWNEVQKIVASDREGGDQFGKSVAISGNYAVVGAFLEDHDVSGVNTLSNSGSAYIFERDSFGNWNEVQKIVASDRGLDRVFGLSVSISEDRIVIGCNNNPTGTPGTVYIFERDSFGVWSEVQAINASDGATGDNFGYSVSVSGDYAIIGAEGNKVDTLGLDTLINSGSAYIFERYGLGNWIEVQKITACVRDTDDLFGWSVSISGNNAIVGAYYEAEDALEANTLAGSGSAYIFERNGTGYWGFKQKIVASDRGAWDAFSADVSISDSLAVIGAHYEFEDQFGNNTLNGTGSAYIFELDSNGDWNEIQKIVASDRLMNDYFGSSVCVFENEIMIGSSGNLGASGANFLNNAGSVYFYKPKNIAGYVFHDINNNCLIDTTEIGLAGRTILIEPGSIVAQTNTGGIWSVDSLPVGTYIITIDTSGSWESTCPPSQTFTVTNSGSILAAPTFGLLSTQPCPSPNVSMLNYRLRPCFTDNIYVSACNQFTGTDTLSNAYVDIELDSLMTPQLSSLPFTIQGNNTYRFELGNMFPGQCINFTITCVLSCNAIVGQTLCMEARLYPIDTCVLDTIPSEFSNGVSPCLLPWDNSSLAVEGYCQNDSIYFIINNTGQFGNGDMDCYAPVRIYIDGTLTQLDSVQLQGGDSIVYAFAADGRTWRLETDQHPLHPGNSNPNAIVETCGDLNNWTPGLVNIQFMDDADPVVDIHCLEVSNSHDPNDKTGYPKGVTDDHLILPNQKLQYVIRFQNTGTDTAYTVVIRDTLDIDLNIFSVIPEVSSHNYSFTKYGPRVLEWTFNNILLPDSTTDEAGSHGFVNFSVRQVADLPNGTLIENSADIYFDFNAPVITNQTLHTVDDMLGGNALDINQFTYKDETLVVYPNPVSNQLNIAFSEEITNGSIELINITGQTLLDKKINHKKNLRLDMKEVPAGVYFIKINSESKTTVVKVIKE